jgi:hypothetical protein
MVMFMYGAVACQHTGVHFPRTMKKFTAAFAVIVLYVVITMKEVIVSFADVALYGAKTLGGGGLRRDRNVRPTND